MKKKETEAQARERRKKQYGCDGLCYGGMNDDGVMCQPCGGIDTCEETRYIEAFATWGEMCIRDSVYPNIESISYAGYAGCGIKREIDDRMDFVV